MSFGLFDLSARVAIVTGAGANGGIGHAIALGLAHHGADVVAADIDLTGAETTAREIANLGRQSLAVQCDVMKLEQIEQLFARVDHAFGRIDILVNNACVSGGRMRPEEMTQEVWNKTLTACLNSAFLCSQHAIRRMLQQSSGGNIVNVSSIMSMTAFGRGNLSYTVAKSGVNQLTKELAVEFAGRGIRVNAVLPAHVNTAPMRRLLADPKFGGPALRERILRSIPLNRMLEPEEFVGPVVFLCSPAASAVTGVLLPVDGGNLALNAGGSHTWPDD